MRTAAPRSWLAAGVVAITAAATVWSVAAEGQHEATPPEPPRLWLNTTYNVPTGRTIAVREGGSFQTALDVAEPGDVITLQAGATYVGPFTLPAKDRPGWIVIRTSATDDQLPPPGVRIDPSYARVLPKLEAASGSVITAAPGAQYYRFIGLEIRPAPNVFLYQLVDLGSGARVDAALPHNLVFDRMYLHGDPQRGLRRAIALNSRTTAVIDSYISDCKEVGAEAQAILGWGGPGPFKIVNNYLEGAGENVMFGGVDPAIPNLVPADIEIRRNHFAKPRQWRQHDPLYQGKPWTVKNLFELKNARRVLVEGNLFEYNWPQAQNGFAILFTPRNQDGRAPWAVVEDVSFVNNVVRHVGSAVNVLGYDDIHASEQTRRIRIANNLFEDIGGAWGQGRLFQLLNGASDVIIENNTALQTADILAADGRPTARLVYRNNIAPHNQYGVIGTGTGPGRHTIGTYFPGAVVKKNVIAGGHAPQFPAENFFPSSLDEVGFVGRTRGDYRLAPTSRYRRAGTDGADPGVDFDALLAAMSPLESLTAPAKRK
jgi:hypothetical protein